MKRKNTRERKLNHALASLVPAALLAASTLQARADGQTVATDATLKKVHHIVVIYQENWSFDSLYGQFPGADGLQNGFDTLPHMDKTYGYTNHLYATPVPFT